MMLGPLSWMVLSVTDSESALRDPSGSGRARRPLPRAQAVRARRRRCSPLVAAAVVGVARLDLARRGGPAGVAGDAGARAAGARVRRRDGGLDVLADALRVQGREVTVVDLPGDDTGDLDQQARELEKAAILALDRTGAGRSTWSATRPAVWSPGSGSRARRRPPRPPRRDPGLTAPRHRPGRARRRPGPGHLSGRLPTAPPGQRPAPQAQRGRRDTRGPPLGLDLDDRRPDRRTARLRVDSRALSTSPCSRSAPARSRRHGELPSDPAVIRPDDRWSSARGAPAGPWTPRSATAADALESRGASVLDVLGREVGPAGAEQHHDVHELQDRCRATTLRHRIGSRNRSTNASQ